MEKKSKITLKAVRQSPSYCGPASLESLLDFYGISATEEELAKKCGTTREHGTDHAGMANVLRSYGFDVTERANGTWDEMRDVVKRGTPVVVGWFSDFEEPFADHYSVVFHMTDRSIYMMDPEIGGTRKMNKVDFLRHWNDFDTPQNLEVSHWYLFGERK